jgi:DNA repair exonuclease SbcCD nuclease subunit
VIFVTGDTHGGIDMEKLSRRRFREGKALTREDYLIICGDFGFPFLTTDMYPMDQFVPNKHARTSQKSCHNFMKWFSQQPYTVLWLDGNHDNHPFWYSQPSCTWKGGLVNVHPLADNVLHLKRGGYYTIDGPTFWVMGGAESHDKEYRTPGYSWWEGEIPSPAEMEHGVETLASHSSEVDFILSHTIPQCLIAPSLTGMMPSEPTRDYLSKIYRSVRFRYWFAGHLHQDQTNEKYRLRLCYNEVVNLEEFMREPKSFQR